jgi:hydroxymethylpyrimidine/phosphomethylpyrimidine kinase
MKDTGMKDIDMKDTGMKDIDMKGIDMKKILTIAGSDCSGGAGIQADIKTITVHGMYAMSAITALTAQNTTGVYGVMEATPEFVGQQLDCIFKDITPDAVKIGMVSNIGIIKMIADKLVEYKARNIVLDPVMVSTSGSKLLSEDAIEVLVTRLLPLAAVITPNIPETEALTGMIIESGKDMLTAAVEISKILRGGILIKGGHLSNSADDLLYLSGVAHWFHSERIDNPNTHGTGCTLSSAIACNLALGFDLQTSVSSAKEYVRGALKAGLDLGKGSGPLNHCYKIIASN